MWLFRNRVVKLSIETGLSTIRLVVEYTFIKKSFKIQILILLFIYLVKIKKKTCQYA